MNYYDFEPPDDSGDALERDDALWDVLGQAKPVEVSPFFSRDILRQIRIARQCPDSLPMSALLARWRPALIGATGLAIVTVNGLLLIPKCERPPAPHIADAETIRNLDELLAYEPTDVWLDKSAY